MRFNLHLEENEEITTLGITTALLDFVRQHNEFHCTSQYIKPIDIEDIANIIKIICESDKKWLEYIKELQNE